MRDNIKIEMIKSDLNKLCPPENPQTNFEDLLEILEEDPRIKRVSATGDMLEIYTAPIIINQDEVHVKPSLCRITADRHKKLNFGEFLILIKPGFIPTAIPYNVSEYNVPPMYRRYVMNTYNDEEMEKGFSVKSHSSSLGLYAINLYGWYTAPVGKALGCGKIENNYRSHNTYTILTPHPHVDSVGHICYGNIGSMLYDAYESHEIGFIIELTLEVLFSYSDENPYYALWKPDPCAACPDANTSICNTCGCYSCENHERCLKCQNFRSISLSTLKRMSITIEKVRAADLNVPHGERISAFKEKLNAFIEEYMDNDGYLSKEDLLYALENGNADDILRDDFDPYV